MKKTFIGLIVSVVMLVSMIVSASASVTNETVTDAEARTATLSFVGDCCISTYKGGSSKGSLNWYAQNYDPSYFLKNVADIFNSDDLTIANCETVLSDRNLTARDKGSGTAFWFTGPTSNAKIFSSSGIDVVGVSNNHTNDYGSSGGSDTVKALQTEGLTVGQTNVPVYVERNGITFGIVACGIWSSGQADTVASILPEMSKKSDIQIVYPHGGTEGNHTPEKWRMTAFRELIDAGADMVIASHAHVLQPMEIYHGKTIIYGLGNFCFGGNRKPENRTIIYQATVTKNNNGTFDFKSNIIPCYVYTGSTNNWQPTPISDKDSNYAKVKDFMSWQRKSPV